MSLTLSCKLVKVFAVICAVLLQNQDGDSVVLQHQIPHFQSPPSNLLTMVALHYGGLQSLGCMTVTTEMLHGLSGI